MEMWSFAVFVLTVACFFVNVESEDDLYKGAPRNRENSRIMFPPDFSRGHTISEPNHQHSPGYHSYRGFPPDFQHSPQFHANDNKFRNTFRETDLTNIKDEDDDHDIYNAYKGSLKIPLDFIQSINDYNVSDLLLNFVEGDTEVDEPFLASRFGDDGARNAAVIPKAAGCEPELTTIKLATSDDPSILYIPQCTRVERCGGCCSHTLLACQPKETETLSYQVMKTQYTGGRKLKFVGKEVIVVEKHTKCKCDCKIKEEDCNKYQEYRKSECRCACTNYDEEKKCDKSGSKKLWNPELCACQCRDILQCSTGYSFDQNECRCMPSPMKRRYANYERRSYASEPSSDSQQFEDFF